ncbi:hypothetical protein V8F33_000625 [Rhypophila sp. PSN 637]
MRPLISTSLFSLHLFAILLFSSSFITSSSSSSVAWAAEDGSAAQKPYLHLRHARGLLRGVAGEKLEEADNLARSQPEGVLIPLDQQQNPPQSPSPTIPTHKALSPLQVAQSQITPAPSLQKRQDNNNNNQNQGQINALSDDIRRLSESFRSVSQASQQVSQSSQQLSQSLQQATQRLIQTEASIASLRAQKDVAEQASRSATQQANDASRRADEASASADRAVSAAFSEASRSASEMMASITREMAASASSAIAQASEAASRILQVQAQATTGSDSGTATTPAPGGGGDASQAAQGAPSSGVSLTPAQVALAVVGGILGGALVTIVGVVLVLRLKRKKKERERMRLGGKEERGYPPAAITAVRGPLPPVVGDYKMADYDDESNYSNSPPPSSRYSAVGYPPDIKEPQPPPPAAVVVGRSTSTGRKPGVGVGRGGPGGFKLGDPPGPKSKFTLFPSPSATSTSPRSGGSPNARGSKANFPSLDTWLRNGTTVSPFATVDKAGAAALGVGIATTTEGTGRKSPEWPIRRS